MLSAQDNDGNLLPLSAEIIEVAFQWLLDALKLPDGLFEAPSFVIRVFHSINAKGPPEVDLLNSFSSPTLHGPRCSRRVARRKRLWHAISVLRESNTAKIS